MKRFTASVSATALLVLAATASSALAAPTITPDPRGLAPDYDHITTASLGDHFYSGVNVSGGGTLCMTQCGTLNFGTYPPSDPTCMGTALDPSTNQPFYGDSGYFTGLPPGVTATQLGTYRMSGSVTGTVNGNGLFSCTTAVTVTKAHPALTVAPSATTVTVGTPVHATATLTDAYMPSAPVTVRIFGPDDPTCAGVSPVSDAVVAGPGPYVGPDYVPTALGTYHAKAIFPGDANNDGNTANCGPTTVFDVEAAPVTPKPPPGTTAEATGQRAAALKKCKKKKSKKARTKCKKKAKKLPI